MNSHDSNQHRTAAASARAIIRHARSLPVYSGSNAADVLAWALGYELRPVLGFWFTLAVGAESRSDHPAATNLLDDVVFPLSITCVFDCVDESDLATRLRFVETLARPAALLIDVAELGPDAAVDLHARVHDAYVGRSAELPFGLGAVKMQASMLLIRDDHDATDPRLASCALGIAVPGLAEVGEFTEWRTPPVPSPAPKMDVFPLAAWRSYVAGLDQGAVRRQFDDCVGRLCQRGEIDASRQRNVAALQVAVRLIEAFCASADTEPQVAPEPAPWEDYGSEPLIASPTPAIEEDATLNERDSALVHVAGLVVMAVRAGCVIGTAGEPSTSDVEAPQGVGFRWAAPTPERLNGRQPRDAAELDVLVLLAGYAAAIAAGVPMEVATQISQRNLAQAKAAIVRGELGELSDWLDSARELMGRPENLRAVEVLANMIDTHGEIDAVLAEELVELSDDGMLDGELDAWAEAHQGVRRLGARRGSWLWYLRGPRNGEKATCWLAPRQSSTLSPAA